MFHKKNKRKGKSKTAIRQAKHMRESERYGGGGDLAILETDARVLHQSPPKVDSTGVPLYGRQLYSVKAMAILRKKK